MTRDEAININVRVPPVRLADGKFGMLTHFWEVAGVTVPGEERIREISYERLTILGNGHVVEHRECGGCGALTTSQDHGCLGDAPKWYPCACGAEHDTPTCPFGAA